MSGLSKKTLSVPKTIKLFINGEFPRTESGRSFPCYYHKSKEVYAHLCQASRKDLRAAVSAAKDAQPSWAKRTAYNRSQILYRMAEMAEGNRAQFCEILESVSGLNPKATSAVVDDMVAAFVYYAGFTDKFQQVMGAVNPVSGPHHNFTSTEPVGVVGLIASEKLEFAKLIADISAIICSGNTVVVLLPQSSSPLLAALAETLATSDLPKGVINLLSGSVEELASQFGSHMEVHALSYQGNSSQVATELKSLSVENMKRFTPLLTQPLGLENIISFVEFKTVWHPIGV